MELEIRRFPCLSDNYGFLVHDVESGETAAIDTPDAARYLAEAEAAGWRITQVWNTHWHADHAGGNLAIKNATGAVITGPAGEAGKIPGLDRLVDEGDKVSLGRFKARVYDAPGHTNGHILYRFDDENVAFVGDTIFAMGCGRLFEGTPAQMTDSLSKIAAWPDETRLYCAHEYTLANGRFALSVEPGNEALKRRMDQVQAARARGEPTVPTSVALEKATNPFLRSDSAELQNMLGMSGRDPVDVFAETRARKDRFRPLTR